jgi:hypothetical protein
LAPPAEPLAAVLAEREPICMVEQPDMAKVTAATASGSKAAFVFID